MGFYDSRIKKLFESCPRLVILAINSIFQRNHLLDADVLYLNREQNEEDNSHFMDMLVQVENRMYHFEFQLNQSKQNWTSYLLMAL